MCGSESAKRVAAAVGEGSMAVMLVQPLPGRSRRAWRHDQVAVSRQATHPACSEALNNEQLATMCANGHVETFEPGPICLEGEPATCYFVRLEGELMMSKLSRPTGHRNQPRHRSAALLRRLARVHRRKQKF